MLDSIPADRRQANTETIRRPTHTVCSYTPDYESMLNRWADFLVGTREADGNPKWEERTYTHTRKQNLLLGDGA